jgi:hypothetical protein
MIDLKPNMLSLCFILICLPRISSLQSISYHHHVRSNYNSNIILKSALHGSRRDLFECSIGSIISSVCVVGSSMSVMQPDIAYADVDFNAIQDLLGPTTPPVQEYVPGGKRPMYLVEPTEEFKKNEEKALEFKRQNIQIKKSFIDAIEKITTDPNESVVLANDLDRIRKLVTENRGLPEGITKDEIIRICRRRKAKKFWPTDVEIA